MISKKSSDLFSWKQNKFSSKGTFNSYCKYSIHNTYFYPKGYIAVVNADPADVWHSWFGTLHQRHFSLHAPHLIGRLAGVVAKRLVVHLHRQNAGPALVDRGEREAIVIFYAHVSAIEPDEVGWRLRHNRTS